MNIFIGIGRLTNKPTLTYSSSNKPYTKFSLAINRPKRENGTQETDFINCVVWNKQAENVCNYLDKGSLVAVEGRVQTGSYTDKEGNKKYTTDIMTDNVQFLESKKSGQAVEKSPYDFTEKDSDPFADFGEQIQIDIDDVLD
jgi:single-strand DNA-binding protein